jgi:hypothetical protein
MATTIGRSLLLLLSALGAACGADRGTLGTPDSTSAMLDEASSENVRHAEVCRHATSMPDMLSDVARHELTMNGITARMMEANDGMRTDMMQGHACSEQPFDNMSQDLTGTNAEVALHTTRMQGLDNVGAGHYECAVHLGELRKELDSMRTDLATMPCSPNGTSATAVP